MLEIDGRSVLMHQPYGKTGVVASLRYLSNYFRLISSQIRVSGGNQVNIFDDRRKELAERKRGSVEQAEAKAERKRQRVLELLDDTNSELRKKGISHTQASIDPKSGDLVLVRADKRLTVQVQETLDDKQWTYVIVHERKVAGRGYIVVALPTGTHSWMKEGPTASEIMKFMD